MSKATRSWLLIGAQVLFVAGAVVYFATLKSPEPVRPGGLPGMPTKVTDEAERRLYLTPGGKYTEDDIRQNGGLTASQKYPNFHAAHDADPKPGDQVCPVTKTKANPACTWVVGGQRYEFCCPPCIDEFVRRAKEQPETIEPPESYRKPG